MPLTRAEFEDYEVFEEQISAALNQNTSKGKECIDLVNEEKTKIILSLGSLSEIRTRIEEGEGCDEMSGGEVLGKKSNSDVMEADFVNKADSDKSMLEKNELEFGHFIV